MRKRIIVLGLTAALLVAIAVAAAAPLSTLVDVGSGYTAKQMCSCLYVSNRTLASCTQELDALAKKLVRWSVAKGEVHATTLGLAHATARYDEGFGCVLDDARGPGFSRR